MINVDLSASVRRSPFPFCSFDLCAAQVRVRAVIPMFHTFASLSPRPVSPLTAGDFLSNFCSSSYGSGDMRHALICSDDLGDGCLLHDVSMFISRQKEALEFACVIKTSIELLLRRRNTNEIKILGFVGPACSSKWYKSLFCLSNLTGGSLDVYKKIPEHVLGRIAVAVSFPP